jgi:hypothetical protein
MHDTYINILLMQLAQYLAGCKMTNAHFMPCIPCYDTNFSRPTTGQTTCTSTTDTPRLVRRLRDDERKSPAVLSYLGEENAYTCMH